MNLSSTCRCQLSRYFCSMPLATSSWLDSSKELSASTRSRRADSSFCSPEINESLSTRLAGRASTCDRGDL